MKNAASHLSLILFSAGSSIVNAYPSNSGI